MGGDGSGRKPDISKHFQAKTPIATSNGSDFFIPNYSGVKPEALRTSTVDITGSGSEVNDLTSAVTWANVPDANITESSVTQHEAAIDHNNLTNTHNLTTDIDHDALTNFVANEHIDWTSDAGASNIHVNNITAVPEAAVTAHQAAIDHDALTNFTATEHFTKSSIAWTDMATGTDGEVPTFSATGTPVFVSTGTSGQVLTSNGAGAAPTFQDSAGGASQLSDLSDVNTSTATNRNVLVADGVDWESRALVEADISDLGTYATASNTMTFTNKTFDANGTGNSLSNVDVADLANGTDGELITWDAAGAPATVSTGTSGQVLTSNGVGTAPTFQNASSGFSDPMTTRGDIIYKNSAGNTTRLPAGTANQVLTSDGTDISWAAAAAGGTKEVWVEAIFENSTNSAKISTGNWRIDSLGSTDHSSFQFRVPNDFTTLVSADVIIIPDATETIQWDIDLNYAALGETYNNATNSATDQTKSVTINVLTAVDISGQFTGVAANDFVAFNFQSDTTSIDTLGFLMKYT